MSRSTGYLAAPGFLNELLEELGGSERVFGDLVLREGAPRPAAWARNIWLDPVPLPAPSIACAARSLLATGQRRWALYSHTLHRRAKLIAARLPRLSDAPIDFDTDAPLSREPLGSFTLLDSDLLLAATSCTSPFSNGEVRFVEDRTNPPSRAYLKLWEALVLLGRRPAPAERCLDLGSSPGAWTWALARLGARVLAVDKAPLDPRVARLPGVEFLRASAFALEPEQVGPVDWLFSDVVCYPEKLLRLVEKWLASGLCRRMICTVKFQGRTDHDAARAFAALEGTRLVHLHHNRHELTFFSTGSIISP